jgi:hypothetical protein
MLSFISKSLFHVRRNNFISNDRCHSYYNDTSIFLHQQLAYSYYIDDYSCSKEYCYLHSLYGKRFVNRLKLINLSTQFHEEDPHFYILGYGHFIGILCLYLYEIIVLWNPTTDQSHTIPPNFIEFVVDYEYSLVRLNGFGYDHVRDEMTIRLLGRISIFIWDPYGIFKA